MKQTRTITVSGDEIIENYVSQVLGLTVANYNKIFPNKKGLDIHWSIKKYGDVDKGDYKEELRELSITIEDGR